MSSDRDQVVDRILAIEKHVYQFIQRGGLPHWAAIDLTMPQTQVLVLTAASGPLPTSQVARTLGMTLSTTTGVVDRLESQGLVRRMADPADRRVVLLQATPEGRELIDRLLQGGRLRFKEILDQLDLEDLHVVSHALDILHSAAVVLGAEPLATGAQSQEIP